MAPNRLDADWAAFMGELAALLGDRLSAGEAVRRQHANTLTWLPAELPDAVVWPNSAQDVAHIVRLAARYRVPLIPFGAGTSLEGHVNAPEGGVSIDLSLMNRILAANPEDMNCTVEAGVRRGDLDRHLRDTGLFFSVDPGTEDATIGGMAATRASGTTSVRYGTMRDNVIRLKAVTADGSILTTGRRVSKSAAGYDLTRLLVGSEGTLGIITELTLRLFPRPAATAVAIAGFPDVTAACAVVVEALQRGLGVARIELLDAVQIAAINRYSNVAMAEVATLLTEFHGSDAGVATDVEVFAELAHAGGAIGFDSAREESRRRQLWRARHDAFWAIKSLWPGRASLVTDVCVPVSRLAECVSKTADDIRTSGLLAPIVGHVGDGNFHTIVVFDDCDSRERAAVGAFLDRLTTRAIGMDGTCTGEHGIGQGKRAALAQESDGGIAAMRRIKQALDPQGILNPGKIFSLSD